VVEQATHDQDAARLERALASLAKDKARLAKARPLAEKAYDLFQKNGYEFCMALAQKELADEDLLSAQLGGDAGAKHRAAEEYKSAKNRLDAYVDCWDVEIEKSLAQARE